MDHKKWKRLKETGASKLLIEAAHQTAAHAKPVEALLTDSPGSTKLMALNGTLADVSLDQHQIEGLAS